MVTYITKQHNNGIFMILMHSLCIIRYDVPLLDSLIYYHNTTATTTRFAQTSPVDAEEIRRNMYAKNTIKTNKNPSHALKFYRCRCNYFIKIEI